MKQKVNFFLWPLLFFVLTIFDLISTYYSTPKLANEANPIVNKYKLGWVGFVLFLSFTNIFFISIYFFHFFVFNYSFKGNVLNKKLFIFAYIFNRYESFSIKILTSKPHLLIESFIYAVTNFLGYFWIRVLVYTKAYAIVDNIVWGFYVRNYTLIKDSGEKTEFVMKNNFLKDYDKLHKLVFWYINEDRNIEVNWFPAANIFLMIVVSTLFLRFEYTRFCQTVNYVS